VVETAWEDKTLCQKIIDRQGRFANLREPYDSRFADIVDFCDPNLTAWNEDTEGQFRGKKIYEGTPPWALRVMGDGWLGTLLSETLRWFKYVFPEPQLRGNDQINKWLQNLEEHMYSVYRNSELYSAMPYYTRAALSVGSPVILPYEHSDRYEQKIKCEVPHPKENYYGAHYAYHRLFQMTALDAVKKFMDGKIPEDTTNAKLSHSILEDYKNGNHSNRHFFIRAIYRNDDPILDGQPQKYRNKPWMEFYVEKGADEQHKNDPLLVQGYWTKPHIRWDYEKNSDEYYARTPSWHAIQDIRSGQEIAKMMLEAAQRSLNPPMWSQRKFKGHLNLRPKGFTYYDNPEEQKLKPEPIQERINYPIGDDAYNLTRQSVERWYHVDLFRILSELAREKKGWPTATHIIHMNAEKTALLAPRVGRFTYVVRENDNRFMDIEQRAGRLPQPPDIVLEYMAYKRIMGERKLRLTGSQGTCQSIP